MENQQDLSIVGILGSLGVVSALSYKTISPVTNYITSALFGMNEKDYKPVSVSKNSLGCYTAKYSLKKNLYTAACVFVNVNLSFYIGYNITKVATRGLIAVLSAVSKN